MGEGPDQINMNDPNATYIMRPDGAGEGDNVSPDDIAQTRSEMSGTISALGDKLNPHTLAEEAKDVASDTTLHAKQAVLEVVDHAKEAIPGIVAGANRPAKDAASDVIHQAKDTVTDLVQQVREALPEAAGNAARHAVGAP